MTDPAPTTSSLPSPDSIIAKFTPDLSPATKLGMMLAAFPSTAPLLIASVLPSGRHFAYSPGLSPQQMVDFLTDVLSQSRITAASTLPFLQVSFGDSLGNASQHADGATVANAFTTIGFDTVVVDTATGFDKAGGIYTVPQDGIYQLLLTFRLSDGSVAAGVSYGVGMDTKNGDSPGGFYWSESSIKRQDVQFTRIAKLTKGDKIRAFYYADKPAKYTSASLTIVALR